MRSRTGSAACAAAAVLLLAFARPASAGAVIFDSLDSPNSGEANTSIDPIISATFSTGASAVRVDVALLLSAVIPDDGDTYTISLDGGLPLSGLSFDPVNGLSYAGSPVDFDRPVVMKSGPFPVTSLPATPTVEWFDQFSGVLLNPNSLYWIEVRVNGGSVLDWGMTGDVSGPGVAGNYLAWFGTNEGFFLNEGVQPYAIDQALQMEILDPVPEPSTWLIMAVGFASLGFFARSTARRPASA